MPHGEGDRQHLLQRGRAQRGIEAEDAETAGDDAAAQRDEPQSSRRRGDELAQLGCGGDGEHGEGDGGAQGGADLRRQRPFLETLLLEIAPDPPGGGGGEGE
jgi:hypothetical protein